MLWSARRATQALPRAGRAGYDAQRVGACLVRVPGRV